MLKESGEKQLSPFPGRGNISSSESRSPVRTQSDATGQRRTKKCARCKQEKSLEMFHKDKNKPDDAHSWCKECRNEARRRSIHYHANYLVNQARNRARRKGLPFALTKERVLKTLEAGHCEVTGIPFSPPGIDPRGPFTPSVDRKVPSLGYTDDNVQIVVRIHNAARGSWGDDILNVYIKHMARRAEEG